MSHDPKRPLVHTSEWEAHPAGSFPGPGAPMTLTEMEGKLWADSESGAARCGQPGLEARRHPEGMGSRRTAGQLRNGTPCERRARDHGDESGDSPGVPRRRRHCSAPALHRATT
jgi:hypothetical protein